MPAGLDEPVLAGGACWRIWRPSQRRRSPHDSRPSPLSRQDEQTTNLNPLKVFIFQIPKSRQESAYPGFNSRSSRRRKTSRNFKKNIPARYSR